MKNLIGLALDRAVSQVEKMGKSVEIKHNFCHQQQNNPTLLVTNAIEGDNKVVLVVGEYFLGEKDV